MRITTTEMGDPDGRVPEKEVSTGHGAGPG
jgi:hypothetical protein